MEARRIKIVSDGTSTGTRIYAVCADGEEIRLNGIAAVQWNARGSGLPTCHLELCPGLHSVEVEAGVDQITVNQVEFPRKNPKGA